MDFCVEFQSVEGILKMKERSGGQGSLLKQIDNKLLCEIIEKLKSSLFANYNMTEITQRKITFFLILQTDLVLSSKLEFVFEIAHLVRVLISGSLLVEIVWGLGFQKYYYEMILHGPYALGEELTKLVIAANLNVKDCVSAAKELTVTIFNKMQQMEQLVDNKEQKYKRNILNKYFGHFVVLLQSIIITENGEKCLSEEEIIINRLRLQSILQLTGLCFSKPTIVDEPPAEYKFALNFDYSHWIDDCDISFSQFKCKIVEYCTACVKNANISTLLWCQWVEIDSDIQGKSFQRYIGEEMYNCMLALKEASLAEASELISILKMMALKPESEDDEIAQADLQTILKNVCDESKTHNKWLAALLKVDVHETRFEECLSLIENSVPIEFDLITEVVDFVIRSLNASNRSDYKERLKMIVLTCLKTYSLNEQIEALKSYFENYGVTTLLKMDDFSQEFTEVFNKAVTTDDTIKTDAQFFSGVVSLCWQSPEEVLMKMLVEGVSNASQTVLMLEAFEIFRPICNLHEMSNNAEKKDAGLLIETIIKFFGQMELKEQEETNLVQLVTSLAKESIIDKDIFLELCIAPTLCQCLSTEQSSNAILCLKIIEAVVEDVELKKLIPMVVMLSQVIHVTRCDLLSFTTNKSAVCDQACIIIKSIVSRLRTGEDLLEERSIAWIESKTARLEAINKPYFFKLRSKNLKDRRNLSAEDLILIGLQSGRIDPDALANAKDGITEDDILCSLVKILPKMSTREWKCISSLKQLLMKSESDDIVLNVFNMLAETLMIINCIVKSQFAQHQQALACIGFCIRNFALFVQDEVLALPPKVSGGTSVGSLKSLRAKKLKEVFQKMLLLLESLPDLIKEPCSIFLLALMKRILNEVVLLESTGKGCCSEQTTVEMCSLISLISLSDVRVALAQGII